MSQRVIRRPERNAEKLPADVVPWTLWLSGDFRRLAALPVTRWLGWIGEIHDVAQPLLLIPLRRCQIENVVGIDVLFVEPIVLNGPIRPSIAKNQKQAIAAAAGRGIYLRNDYRCPAWNRVDVNNQSIDDVARESSVVPGDVECARKRIALTVQGIEALNLLPDEG